MSTPLEKKEKLGVTPQKLAFLIQHLHAGGGGERVAANLSIALCKDYDVTFILYEYDQEKSYPKKGRILLLPNPYKQMGPFRYIPILNRLIALFLRQKSLKRIKRENKIELTLSLLFSANFLNTLSRTEDKIILSVQEPKSSHESHRGLWGKINKIAIKLLYNRADKIICASKGVAWDLIKNFRIKKEKTRVIYNGFPLKEIEKLKEVPWETFENLFAEGPVIGTMGRLTFPKGHWYILRIFKQLKIQLPQLKLVLVGDGDLRASLITLARDLGLRVWSIWEKEPLSSNYDLYFSGFLTNPFPLISKLTLFALPSLWEGFGNVLVETMSCCIPTISSKCPSGPLEILSPEMDINTTLQEPLYGQYGVLLPPFDQKIYGAHEPLTPVEKMWVEVLSRMIQDNALREKYAQLAWERARRFDLNQITKEWVSLFEDLFN